MSTREELESPSRKYFACAKKRCSPQSKALGKDYRDIRNNEFKIRGSIVPKPVHEKILAKQAVSNVGQQYSKCAVEKCSVELGEMIDGYIELTEYFMKGSSNWSKQLELVFKQRLSHLKKLKKKGLSNMSLQEVFHTIHR